MKFDAVSKCLSILVLLRTGESNSVAEHEVMWEHEHCISAHFLRFLVSADFGAGGAVQGT